MKSGDTCFGATVIGEIELRLRSSAWVPTAKDDLLLQT
jgi:hypothetical protein